MSVPDLTGPRPGGRRERDTPAPAVPG